MPALLGTEGQWIIVKEPRTEPKAANTKVKTPKKKKSPLRVYFRALPAEWRQLNSSSNSNSAQKRLSCQKSCPQSDFR